jgi:hypothetical protein
MPGWHVTSAARAPLQPKPVPAGPEVHGTRRHGQGVPPIVRDVLSSPGHPLAADVRAFYESRFDRDFGAVRVHTDAQAASSANAVQAAAFAVGRDLVFGRDAFQPDTANGRRLIGHELAHIAQQPATAVPSGQLLTVGSPDDQAEREADAAVNDAGIAASWPRMAHASPGVLWRQLNTPLGQGGGFGGLMQRDRQALTQGRSIEQPPRVPAAIQGGPDRIVELDDAALSSANVEQRLAMLEALIRTFWTGGTEEEAIIRIVRTTPLHQAKTLLRALGDHTVDGKRFLDELDRVVDFSNNLELHTALSELRMKAMGAAKGGPALAAAPVLPWHDVMGFFEDDAVFSVSRPSADKVRVEYPARVHHSRDFAAEIQRLPVELFTSGFDYEPDQILVIHDYDSGRFVPVVAEELAGYSAAGVRGFLGHAATAASFAVPVSAARTALGKAVVFTLERAFPAAFLLIDENRLNIVKWFPNWGPRMLYFADLVKAGVGVYGIARFAVSGRQLFRSWKQVRQARKALEGIEASAEAERVAAALEREADRIFDEVDKLNAEQPQTGTAAGPKAPGTETPPAEAAGTKAPAGPRAATEPSATEPSVAPSAGSEPKGGGRTPPAPRRSPDFPFATGRDLPKPDRPDRIYRIMSNEEAAATLRTGKVQAAQGTGGQMGHKFFSLHSKYPALFKPEQLKPAVRLGQEAAAAERAGNAALAARLRAQAADVIAKWHAAPGQAVLVEIELEPGALEEILRRSVTEPGLDAHRGGDVFIYKLERGSHNIAVPSWQLDRFNAYVKAVQLYGWRAPFGPGQIPKGVQ